MTDKILKKLLGVTRHLTKKDAFFKTFDFTGGDGFSEAGYSAAAIVTAPFLHLTDSACHLILAGWRLLQAIGNVFTCDFDNAGVQLENTAWRVVNSAVAFIKALISPVINLIDFIGSLGATAASAIEEAIDDWNSPALMKP